MTAPSPGELFDLTDRTAVVTGASSGLGARFAAVLAAAGADVWLAARREDRLRETAADNTRMHPVACDISDAEERTRLIETVGAAGGHIDVLVNNAGTSSSDSTEEYPADFTEVLGTNLVAPFHLAQLVSAARATDAPATSVINVSSILGMVSAAPVGSASYAASKAGLLGLTRELAGQWGQSGMRVNALVPGWFPTSMNGELFDDPKAQRWLTRNTMLGRAGDLPELDGALLFLASAASSYCTGQLLVVDGGWTAR